METGRAEMTGALLASKGAATPAGFRNRPARPPPPVADTTVKPTERRGFRSPALWLLPIATVAVAATLTAQSLMTRNEITVTTAAPPAVTPAIIETPVAGEIIQPPAPQAVIGGTPVQSLPPAAAKPVYRVQLHALGSRAEARRAWRGIKRTHDDLFGHKQMTLLSGKNKSSGISFIRLQAGPFSGFRDAQNLCSQARKRRLACVVVRQ